MLISSEPLLQGLQHQSKQCIVPAHPTPLNKVPLVHKTVHLQAQPFSSDLPGWTAQVWHTTFRRITTADFNGYAQCRVKNNKPCDRKG